MLPTLFQNPRQQVFAKYKPQIEAINEIYKNYNKYKKLINYDYLNIDLAADQYQLFIKKIYNEKII